MGTNCYSVALGDIDTDGDLDLVVANQNGPVRVGVNGGSGAFTFGATVSTGGQTLGVTLGDVDADGDLDLLAANANANGTVSVHLNNGSGTFSGGSEPAVGAGPRNVALADVDGDGDLDLLASNSNTNTVSVRFNQPPAPTLTALSPAAELAGMPVLLTGTNFTAGSIVTFGGVAASSVTYNLPTSLTAVVPAGAAGGSSAVVVSASGGSSPGSPAFSVLTVYCRPPLKVSQSKIEVRQLGGTPWALRS